MHRTVRALSVAVLAGAALVIAGPTVSAAPADGASPGTVRPGAGPTASVPCEALTGLVPDIPDDTPPAFADGTAQCDEGQGKGQGQGQGQGETPGLAPGQRDESGAGQGERQDSGAGQETGQWQEPGAGQETTGQGREQGQGQGQGQRPGQGQEQGRECEDSHGSACSGEHGCRDEDGGNGNGYDGDNGGNGYNGGKGDDGDCGRATEQGGVAAGTGGSFDDSVPALVAGGVLIAASCGGAVYRLSGRRRPVDG
ncbi:hypothetical protein [Streptomyces sp. PTD9-10]|uniref:hypothetical protein n=1 Tax=Streptomyces sp. PTD9-10 TaxID=3120151 RepID=UPI00300BB7A6